MLTFLILICSFILSFYLYMTRNYNYWSSKNIKYVKPTPIIGNILPVLMAKQNAADIANNVYRQYKNEPYVGIYLADCPCLIVNDYELVKKILVSDFANFTNRSISCPKELDPISSSSLFLLRDLDWKNTRAKISPLFTSKKQKHSFFTMNNVMNRLDDKLKQSNEIDVMDFALRISVDLVSDSVFRLQGRAISHDTGDLLKKLADMLTIKDKTVGIQANLTFLIPQILNKFRIAVFPQSFIQAIRDTVKQVLKLIETSAANIKGDYIDSLLELKDKEPWEGNKGELIQMDEDTLISHLFMFVTAGFETTSIGIGVCLYELARNPDIQETLRSEIKDVLNENGDVFTYESLKQFPTVLKFINECLRKHPPFPFVNRECTKDYNIPGTDIVINKGVKILLPMMALHNDEKFYKNPDEIILDRFDPKSPEAHGPFFPFGLGPRICLGMKFAMQGLLMSLVTVLNKYRLTCDDTGNGRITTDPIAFNSKPKERIVIKVDLI